MSFFASFIVMSLNYLPWLAIGVMGALAWRTRKDSKALMLQAGGAAALLTFGVGRWIVLDLLLIGLLKAGSTIAAPVGYIFGFLQLVALFTFAMGYCMERFANRKPAVVTATPA